MKNALSLVVLLLALHVAPVNAGYVTFGDLYNNGSGYKWDNPTFGTPATITWAFMADGTTIHPNASPDENGNGTLAPQISGGSNLDGTTGMRTVFDATYGTGAFNQAIQNAFDEWARWGDVTFVYVANDGGGQVGHNNNAASLSADIRIGAFTAVANTGFAGVAAFGFSPPFYDDNPYDFQDALAGDILFNLNQPFFRAPGNEGDPIDHSQGFRNDLEGLALHEIGHALGLGHPDSGPGDVMYVGAGCCDFINRQLSADDIAGIQRIYNPEPSSMLLTAIGLCAGLCYWRWSRTADSAASDASDAV